MSEQELIEILKELYNSAEEGLKATSVHFFGMKYADELQKSNISINRIAEKATENKYGAEIRKGIRLIRYLKNKNFEIKSRAEKSYSKTNSNFIKNIILYGPPGVGKTYNVTRLINLLDNGQKNQKEIFDEIRENRFVENILDEDLKNRVEFITFHQSFSYEDFIEGFRPNEKGEIKLQDGVFKKICNEAKENRDKNYYLIIDEINRGNISNIFGELITLIEEDKRELQITLPYSKESFSVPSNLFIIGTMNTTDKSIALIDVALRRRFTFIKLEPNKELVIESFRDKFEEINKKIEELLGDDYKIGHSYFMGIENEDDLKFVLEYKIKPLIEEYFYGNEEGKNEILNLL